MRITLPSEHNIELFTEMEYAGTETGAINPEATAAQRAQGGHALDRSALMPCEDPGLNSSSCVRCWTSRPPRNLVTSIDEPEVIGT